MQSEDAGRQRLQKAIRGFADAKAGAMVDPIARQVKFNPVQLAVEITITEIKLATLLRALADGQPMEHFDVLFAEALEAETEKLGGLLVPQSVASAMRAKQ